MEWKRLILHGSLTRAHEKGSASLNIIFDFFSLTHNFHMYIMKYGSSALWSTSVLYKNL